MHHVRQPKFYHDYHLEKPKKPSSVAVFKLNMILHSESQIFTVDLWQSIEVLRKAFKHALVLILLMFYPQYLPANTVVKSHW